MVVHKRHGVSHPVTKAKWFYHKLKLTEAISSWRASRKRSKSSFICPSSSALETRAKVGGVIWDVYPILRGSRRLSSLSLAIQNCSLDTHAGQCTCVSPQTNGSYQPGSHSHIQARVHTHTFTTTAAACIQLHRQSYSRAQRRTKPYRLPPCTGNTVSPCPVIQSWDTRQDKSTAQQISSCWISGRVGNGGSVKEKVSRPAFSSPWPGQVRYEPLVSRSGEGVGLSGSDSDWLISGSSSEDTGLAWRWGWG